MSFIIFILGIGVGAMGLALYRELTTPAPVVLGVVEISHWAQQAKTPMVSVGVESPRGAQSVYTYAANSVGEARATLYGRGLAHITGLELVDRRAQEPPAERYPYLGDFDPTPYCSAGHPSKALCDCEPIAENE